MKKSNIITFAILFVVTAAVLIFASCSHNDEPEVTPTPEPTTTPMQTAEPTVPVETKTPKPSKAPAPVSMNDTLFIGDSRTVGIREYSGLKDADFFCSVGLNIFDATNETLSVENVGDVTLSSLLSQKKYTKIYIMLGINEVGYPHSSIVDKYSKVLDMIKAKQPDASIFIDFGSKWFKCHMNVKNRENFLLFNIKHSLFCLYLAISSP